MECDRLKNHFASLFLYSKHKYMMYASFSIARFSYDEIKKVIEIQLNILNENENV